jgi:hypothetical protein
MKRGIRLPALAGLALTLAVPGPASTPAAVPVAESLAATIVVRTEAELLAGLAGAVPGDTVYVDGTVSIDLTGQKRVAIPAGVTLASDRGRNGSPGALLFNNELDLGQSETWAQFSIRGAGVRVTGLRLRGPDREIRDNAYQYDNSRGLEVTGASDPLVENNELFGWSHAAVYLGDTIEGRVRGNHIHHNRRTGLGYGVVLVNDTSAVIEDNTFTQNRHAIAGSGIRTQRYDARFNVVTDNALSHGFDMHGENEALGNGAAYAGDVIHIKQNSFRSSAQPAVVIRGRPFTGAWVSGNCFAHGTSGNAVQQRNFTGNLSIGSNSYGTTTGACHQTGRRIAWRFSSGGAVNWADLAPYTFDVSEVGFGDFDGDGRTDVFHTSDRQWRFSAGGAGNWQSLATAGEALTALRFGDFDGDGRTDVFSTAGGQWRYSSGGRTGWIALATSGCALTSLHVAGDFNGDGRSDVFDGRCGG